MTIIVAYTEGKSTWLGSDTHSIGSYSMRLECGKKWYSAYGWAFGHCGDACVADLFENQAATLFANLEEVDSPEHQVVKRIRAMYREAGMVPIFNNEAVGNYQNSGILARAGRFWDIDGNLAVTPIQSGLLFARGCAKEIAIGAAYGYQKAIEKASPEELINVALSAAIRFDIHIYGKWTDVLSG